jgi:hypothetical protein
MVVRPPKCKTCGKIEWQHVCQGVGQPSIGRQYSRAEVDREMKRAAPAAVTKHSVTPVTKASVTRCANCSVLKAEVDAQAAEIAQLKRALAKKHGEEAGKGGRKPIGEKAMSPAERMKAMRERRAKRDGTVQFKG